MKPIKIIKKRTFWHARFETPDQYTEFRTPAWAKKIANSVVKGAKVTTANLDDKWDIQKIMIPVTVSTEEEVSNYAEEIYGKINTSSTEAYKVEGGKDNPGGSTKQNNKRIVDRIVNNIYKDIDKGLSERDLDTLEKYSKLSTEQADLVVKAYREGKSKESASEELYDIMYGGPKGKDNPYHKGKDNPGSEKINQSEYTNWILWRDKEDTGVDKWNIIEGFEYEDDAIERADEYIENNTEIIFTVKSKTHLEKWNIDPDLNELWKPLIKDNPGSTSEEGYFAVIEVGGLYKTIDTNEVEESHNVIKRDIKLKEANRIVKEHFKEYTTEEIEWHSHPGYHDDKIIIRDALINRKHIIETIVIDYPDIKFAQYQKKRIPILLEMIESGRHVMINDKGICQYQNSSDNPGECESDILTKDDLIIMVSNVYQDLDEDISDKELYEKYGLLDEEFDLIKKGRKNRDSHEDTALKLDKLIGFIGGKKGTDNPGSTSAKATVDEGHTIEVLTDVKKDEKKLNKIKDNPGNDITVFDERLINQFESMSKDELIEFIKGAKDNIPEVNHKDYDRAKNVIDHAEYVLEKSKDNPFGGEGYTGKEHNPISFKGVQKIIDKGDKEFDKLVKKYDSDIIQDVLRKHSKGMSPREIHESVEKEYHGGKKSKVKEPEQKEFLKVDPEGTVGGEKGELPK